MVNQIDFNELNRRIADQRVRDLTRNNPMPYRNQTLAEMHQLRQVADPNTLNRSYLPPNQPPSIPTNPGIPPARPQPSPGGGLGASVASGIVADVGLRLANEGAKRLLDRAFPDNPQRANLIDEVNRRNFNPFVPENNPFRSNDVPGSNIPGSLLPSRPQSTGNNSVIFPSVQAPYQFSITIIADRYSEGGTLSPSGKDLTSGLFERYFGIPVSLTRRSVDESYTASWGEQIYKLQHYWDLTWITPQGVQLTTTSQSQFDSDSISRQELIGWYWTNWRVFINGTPQQLPQQQNNDPQQRQPINWTPPSFIVAPPISPERRINNPETEKEKREEQQRRNIPPIVPLGDQQRLANELQRRDQANSNQNQQQNNQVNQQRQNRITREQIFYRPLNPDLTPVDPSTTDRNKQRRPNAVVNPIPGVQNNLNPNQNLNSNASPNQQFREQLERQFDQEPKPSQQSPELCRDQCVADIQNNSSSNNLVAVRVNRFLFWNKLLGRAEYVPEVVMVPRGMEQLAMMVGNRTAEMRGRSALAELRLRGLQILNTIGTVSTLHNAAMLSSDLSQTLGSIIDQGVQRLGPLFGMDNETAEQFDFNTALGGAINAQMEALLGKEVWNGTKKAWHRLNRVVTTASNVLWNLQSITDSTRSLIEMGVENNNRLANALKRNRVVDENAYPTMPEVVNAATGRVGRIQRMMNGLEQVNEAASTLESIVSTVGSIQDELKSSIESAAELKKAWDEATKPLQDKEQQSNQGSKSPEIQPSDRQKGGS